MKKLKSFAFGILSFCMIVAGSEIAMPEVHAAGEKALEVTDNYPDLDGWLAGGGGADTVKIICMAVGAGQTVLPAQVTLLSGWDKSFFGDNGPAQRQIGYNSGSFTFAEGGNTVVQYIDFKLPDKSVVIPAGAAVMFDNCTFSSTIVNNGTAVFHNCTFSDGKIENNGSAEYTGGTTEPENIGNPAPSHIPLGLNLDSADMSEAAAGTAYSCEVDYEVTGTNKDSAKVTASVLPENSGISARTEGADGKGTIYLSGTPVSAGNITVTVKAEHDGDTPAVKNLSLTVNEKLGLRVDGTLDCVTKGQSGYQDYLKVYVKTAGGEETDYHDYESDHAKLQVNLTPEGSGMTASYIYDRIVVSGTPGKSGTYQVTVVLNDEGQTAVSNSVELRVYEGDETLKEQFQKLDQAVKEWDMEPYEIWNSDHAVVPEHLKAVYGSRESGLYGIIGNNQSVASDTLVIPAGCDVTFENMKFYSSVKIIVEEGGCLTLSDSVAYGPIEVNGGTFSMKNSSALTDTLTLNEGSVLKGAEVKSNARFLTDGAVKEDVNTVVIINGTVTASGTNYIEGDCGSGSLAGQTALQVNGVLVIPSGSTLTAAGGGDANYAPGHIGGIGVYLNGGTVTGGGKLTAKGGIGNDGPGGDAIAGTGKIKTEELDSAGGDSQKIIDKEYAGGNAVGPEVIVTTSDPVLKGGSGNPDGTASVTLTKDPDEENPETPDPEDPDSDNPGSDEQNPDSQNPDVQNPDKEETRTEGDASADLDQQKDAGEKGSGTNIADKTAAAVKTGDETAALSWILLLAAAGIASAVICAGRKKEN